jgi:hypothetical protein
MQEPIAGIDLFPRRHGPTGLVDVICHRVTAYFPGACPNRTRLENDELLTRYWVSVAPVSMPIGVKEGSTS